MIYISGSNGFIGKAIYLWLIKNHIDVMPLNRDNLFCSFPKNNEENVLIHCAWEGVLGRERNNNLQIANIKLANSILDFVEINNIKRVIAFGSQAEYGSPNKKVNENSPLNPTTLYGKTKIEVFNLLNENLSKKGVDFVWLRLFDPYGPGDRPEWFLPFIIKNALSNNSPELTLCTQSWDFIYIDDVCSCIETILKSNIRKNDIFNLSSNNPIILKELVNKIFKIIAPNDAIPLFGKIEFREDQVYYLHGCNEKLYTRYNWKPIVGIDQGIKATINFERQILKN